jgi:hypothetical protein
MRRRLFKHVLVFLVARTHKCFQSSVSEDERPLTDQSLSWKDNHESATRYSFTISVSWLHSADKKTHRPQVEFGFRRSEFSYAVHSPCSESGGVTSVTFKKRHGWSPSRSWTCAESDFKRSTAHQRAYVALTTSSTPCPKLDSR